MTENVLQIDGDTEVEIETTGIGEMTDVLTRTLLIRGPAVEEMIVAENL